MTCTTGRVRAGCLAHTRRKIFEARQGAPEANEALATIREIYRVERDAKTSELVGAPKHLAMRTARLLPSMNKLRAWLDDQQSQPPPKSPMRRAVGYALNNWNALRCFLDDGNIAVDNNKAESALRRVALGRKNYQFVGNEAFGDNLASLYSLVATCEANGVNPFEYLGDVLVRVADHPIRRIDELLPHRWNQPAAA